MRAGFNRTTGSSSIFDSSWRQYHQGIEKNMFPFQIRILKPQDTDQKQNVKDEVLVLRSKEWVLK
jgi:hypothetical protein